METAVDRWTAIIKARAQQMDAAYARLGRTSADYWNRRASWFHRSTKESTTSDPLFLKLRSEMTPQTSVLDVGAGTGRFALALAPFAWHVTAVEPNAAMLDFLRNNAREKGVTNITPVQATWQDAPEDLCADIVICSHVLYPIMDIVPFLKKLQAATRRFCYISMRATPFDAITAPLWRHFHGDERCYPPSYIHALDVLYEMGIYANVEVVNAPPSLQFHYSSFDAAVEGLLEQLILPDDAQTKHELRRLLEQWLVEQDGVLVPPTEKMVSAIIWWEI
ncbi:MAG: class I SAM-dependent methyltransferase [Ktedonobacteraceae bacterium]